jgi:DNA replication protein DnaC
MKTSQVLRELNASRADGSWATRLNQYLKPELLIMDDFGLKPFDRGSADDFYEIICERYEKGSLILTSNRAVEEWGELFGDPLLASAALDRMVHHAHAITITGRSYRARGMGSGRREGGSAPTRKDTDEDGTASAGVKPGGKRT